MSATVIRFPRAMKRGAKVRKGPAAALLEFPSFPSPRVREHTRPDGYYAWRFRMAMTMDNPDDWEHFKQSCIRCHPADPFPEIFREIERRYGAEYGVR